MPCDAILFLQSGRRGVSWEDTTSGASLSPLVTIHLPFVGIAFRFCQRADFAFIPFLI
jgi:hypothetical protein